MAKTECDKYHRPVMQAYSADKKTCYLYQPPCKCWDCEPCARQNMYLWAARIGCGYTHYIETGIDGWRMVTITSSSKLKTKDQTLWVWPKAWGKLSTRMRRKYPGVRYVLIPEMHKDGRIHIHMLASHSIKTRWVKDNSAQCGLGYQGKAEKLTDAGRAVWYVTKYLAKSLEIAEWPRSFRRVRTTQGWPKLEPSPNEDGEILEWVYLTTYPSDGLDYLAEGIAEKMKVVTKVV